MPNNSIKPCSNPLTSLQQSSQNSKQLQSEVVADDYLFKELETQTKVNSEMLKSSKQAIHNNR